MTRKNIVLVCIAAFFACCSKQSTAPSTIEWRNDRTGIFNDTGLQKSWHQGGPELLWYYEKLGDGHSSVAISNNRLYVTGMIDSKGYLHVFDLFGNKLNSIMYGEEWDINYPGTRGTPNFSDGKIYIVSGIGDVICFDEKSLEILWKRNMLKDFDSQNIVWGITESPLIIGDKLIVTPGGELHNVVALDKNTGELIWSSPGVGEPSAYCSPIYISDQEIPLIATMTAQHIIGVEATTGELLWAVEHGNIRSIQSNTPVYSENMILVASVYKGSTMIRLTEGGRKAEIAWQIPEFDNMMGGLVKIDEHVFGTCRQRLWYCVNWKTGEIIFTDSEIGASSVTIFADGMFYCYSDRGELSLISHSKDKLNIVSRFNITKGTDQHWAHPVIYQGTLYVRRGEAVMAYKIGM